MDKSDLQELLAALYLRLNGYFSGGFIAHAPAGNMTEIDVLAVRFPNHKEVERQVDPCVHLHPPNDRIDLIVGEVKGGNKHPKFNVAFYQNREAVEKVLNRIGAFTTAEIPDLACAVMDAAQPKKWGNYEDFPTLPALSGHAQVRLVLFAPDQKRSPTLRRPAIYGDDMIGFIWKCLHPVSPPVACAVDYHPNLWGHQFKELIAYFKDWKRSKPGDVDDIYSVVLQR